MQGVSTIHKIMMMVPTKLSDYALAVNMINNPHFFYHVINRMSTNSRLSQVIEQRERLTAESVSFLKYLIDKEI